MLPTTITAGRIRAALAKLPDDTPVYICNYKEGGEGELDPSSTRSVVGGHRAWWGNGPEGQHDVFILVQGRK